jgi:hypothetical protein
MTWYSIAAVMVGVLAVLRQQTKGHRAAAGPRMKRDMALTQQADLEPGFALEKMKVEDMETVDYNTIDCPG